MMGPSLYLPRPEHGLPFGGRYTPPGLFEKGRGHRVAVYPAGCDGRTVVVYETRLPAVVFRLKVLPDVNSAGLPSPGFTIGTGTGMRELAAWFAEAISDGSIVFDASEVKGVARE